MRAAPSRRSRSRMCSISGAGRAARPRRLTSSCPTIRASATSWSPPARWPSTTSSDAPARRTPMRDLRSLLRALGLLATSDALDDLLALATKKRWGPTEILEHIAQLEDKDRARRGLERRMSRSRLERFKPMGDFEWDWPTKIERSLV